MNRLFAAAADVQAFSTLRGWRTAVIGGLAVQRWGEPRQTRDVDLTIITGLGDEARYADELLATYRARIPDARQFAIDRRVLLVESSTGIPLDISFGALPYEGRVVDRATPFTFEPGVTIVTCSAEDLVVLKAFAGRPQDWIDVEGIIVRQASRLDRSAILDELRPLLVLKEEMEQEMEAESQLERLFNQHPRPHD